MRKRRLSLWLTLLIVAVVVLAGCASRAHSGQTAAAPGTEDLVVDLPALVVDISAEGQPSVGNVPLSQIGAMFAPGMLDQLVVAPETVSFLTESNIQHIQIDNTPQGLLILVNGQPIPSLRWDGEILASTGELVEQLGAGMPVLDKFLPLVANLGIGIIVRFPVQAQAEVIPTYIEGGEAALAAKQAQEQFLASVGNVAPTIELPIYYDEQGNWRVGDLSSTEWMSLTGLTFFEAARLDPGMVASMVNAGITRISLYTDADGLHLSINDRPLPYIGWADGEINHLLDLGEQMGLWNTLADSGMNMGEIIGMVETLVPMVQSSDTSINVYFPERVAMSR